MLHDSKKTKILLIVALIILAILATTTKTLIKQKFKGPSNSQAAVYQIPALHYPSSALIG